MCKKCDEYLIIFFRGDTVTIGQNVTSVHVVCILICS